MPVICRVHTYLFTASTRFLGTLGPSAQDPQQHSTTLDATLPPLLMLQGSTWPSKPHDEHGAPASALPGQLPVPLLQLPMYFMNSLWASFSFHTLVKQDQERRLPPMELLANVRGLSQPTIYQVLSSVHAALEMQLVLR